ncbi:hypothetical protein [Streptomyces sp. LRa12]|uniref:hypothetical protein n=1 Tax=Streptomyces sp. LRa12 TaxID=2563107 RepID=UPI0019CF80DA|nr:hypothetical protein [Streptomyces sp. LRa12]
MTENAIEKARKAAESAAAKVAELERQEAEKAAQEAAERAEKQRELDTEFLAQWETLDAQLQEVGRKSATEAVYEGADPITAVAHFWVERAKRNAVRSHARSAYYRLHGVHPDDRFAYDLPEREMRIADRLEEAISTASRLHGANHAEKLETEWMAE